MSFGLPPAPACPQVRQRQPPMTAWKTLARFDGPIVMIGFGSIGRGTLPLLERHIAHDASKFVVMDPDDSHRDLLEEHGVAFIHEAVTAANHRNLLAPLLAKGPGPGLIVNLSVDVESRAVIDLARDIGALYIDTVVEPWPGYYTDPKLPLSARSNYALRETILELRRQRPGGPTAISCCGANPGMVSWFVKQALLNIAADLRIEVETPRTREGWGQLARRLGLKGIHI